MKKQLSKYRHFALGMLLPAIGFGFIVGTLTSCAVTLFKFCATHIINLSEKGYLLLRERLYLLPLVLILLFGFSYLLARIYKSTPNVKGGGIPTSVAILRGIITFKWLRNLVGVFLLSLSSFLIGVPLGNEGPSVQMGTALGRGSVRMLGKKHRAWDRYSMTGGACAGFSCATGSPISGIMFAIEEAHQRLSPTIIITSVSSVVFANITSKLLCPMMGVSESLFGALSLPSLKVYELWIPLVVGIVVGLFSVLLLNYYRLLDKLHDNVLSRVPHFVKIFIILALTVVAGLFSFSFVSTGHHMLLGLFDGNEAIWMLLIMLTVRATLTLGANSSGITGGIFIPFLALGALAAAVLGKSLIFLGLSSQLYMVILVLGIAACIAGSMKMPLTAIVFSIEALSCFNNILPVIIAALVSYLITEMLGAKSVNDTVIELREEYEEKCKELTVIDTYITVQGGAFAIGKQIRDIFWPRNLFVLSLKHPQDNAKMDERGEKEIREGDVLHIRYSTLDEEQTKEELFAIVGEQRFKEKEAKEI